MMHQLIRGGLGVVIGGAIVAGVLGLRTNEAPKIGTIPVQATTAPLVLDTTDHAARLMTLAAQVTPFRATQEPPELRYGETPPPPPPPPVPKPNLSLSGILWGREPAAILEGLPEREGQVLVRQGETAGVLRVTRIDATSVTVSGMDTTWVLQVRQPW